VSIEHPVFYGQPLVFYPASHRYKWGGQWVPAVTTILNRISKGDALVQWAANCAVNHVVDAIETGLDLSDPLIFEDARKAWVTVRDAAANVGTNVHDYARRILSGQSPAEPLEGPEAKAIAAFWKWVESHAIEPYAVEKRIMSAHYMYAGTCDFYGRIDGRLSVLDFKTGNGVYDEFWWQLSAYSLAIDEEKHTDENRHRTRMGREEHVRWIVHLNKTTGECEVHCRDSDSDAECDLAVWRHLVALDKALRLARKHPQPKRAA
jgi:hypothetical protein